MQALINITKPFLVLKITDKCTKPYKRRFVQVEEEHLDSLDIFTEYLNSVVQDWSDGVYLLKCTNKEPHEHQAFTSIYNLIFAKIEVVEGEVKSFLRPAPFSNLNYLCFELFDFDQF